MQAAAVTLPGRSLPLPAAIRGRAWALVLPGVLVAFVIALSIDASLATRLAELAVVTPVLALLAPLVAEQRRRVPVGLVAGVAVVVGLWQQHSVVGGLARAVAIACACAVLATLLAGVAPPAALRIGLVALVVLDVILVVSGSVGTTSNELHHAVAPAGLPSFQDATLGPATMGYGDLFGAAVLGAALSSEGRLRGRAALAVLACAWGFGLLLTVFTTLPATVPLLAGLAVGGQERRSM
ncbi:MAG: hypothetical protein QOJ47_1083 [Gaiellales bacterium]|nr:hypothetical protein [Gaiellales bacterium]